MKKLINFLLIPWNRYKQYKELKKRKAELKKRNPFIYW
jgi:hypothetical protein